MKIKTFGCEYFLKDLRKFRAINESEEKIIFDSISRVNKNIINFLRESQYKLYISFSKISSKNGYPLIFLIEGEISSLIEQIEKNINSAGLYLGFIKSFRFNLSLEGADYFYKHNLFPKSQIIKVNKNGEKSILYGNRVLKKMVQKLPFNLKNKEFILFCNNFNELISIGISQIDHEAFQNLNENDLIALNLIDKGYYLRKQ